MINKLAPKRTTQMPKCHLRAKIGVTKRARSLTLSQLDG